MMRIPCAMMTAAASARMYRGIEGPPELWSREAVPASLRLWGNSKMQNPYASVFLCTGCKNSNGKWKKISAPLQQPH